MKATVLLPVYHKDKPDQLQSSLESIEKQTRPADEVLILVDGKIDQALEAVIDSFSSFTKVVFEKNRGLPTVLNEGLRRARNEIIIRMDADDVCPLNRFELQLNYLENHPEISILGGQIVEFVDDIKNLKGVRKVPTQERDIVRFAKYRSPFNHPTVAYKKSVILEIGGYDTKLINMQDYDLWVRALARKLHVANLPDVLCYMRVDHGFVKKRSGFKYVQLEIYFLKKMRQTGFISFAGFVYLLCLRVPARLLPASLFKIIYKLFLRQS